MFNFFSSVIRMVLGYETTSMKTTILATCGLALLAAVTIGAGPAAAATCPTTVFPNLSNKPGAGAGYVKPSVTVTCSTTRLKVSSNGMPSYTFVAKTPSALRAQKWSWSVPLSPKVAVSTTSIDGRLGTIGFTTTGLPFYGPEEGDQPADEAHGDPIFNGLLDSCYGHNGPMGDYHIHALRWTIGCGFTTQKIVAYAADGFPVYAGQACLNKKCTSTATLQSGYVRTGNPKKNAWDAYTYRSGGTTTLDRCNGRTEPDGSYGYHITKGFPYIIGCFRGTPVTQSGAAAARMPAMKVGVSVPLVPRAFCDLTRLLRSRTL